MSGRTRFLSLALVLLAVISSVLAEDPASQSSSDAAGAASCRNLDAAMRFDNKLYLFSGDEYMGVDDSGNETSVGPISDWGGLKPNIDAAFKWTDDGEHYFIEGNNAYIYAEGRLSDPINSVDVFGPFFEGGIDAAANRGLITHAFKDCVFAVEEDEIEGFLDTDATPLPTQCQIDAAFEKADDIMTMFLIKGNQMWEWGPFPGEILGPRPVSEVFNLKSWTLCAVENVQPAQ